MALAALATLLGGTIPTFTTTSGGSEISTSQSSESLNRSSTPTVSVSPGPPWWYVPPLAPAPLATIPAPTTSSKPTPKPIPSAKARFAETCPPIWEKDKAYSRNREAQAYLRSKLSLAEYRCAWRIIRQESGWSLTAHNSGGACGLPQAWPCSKLASSCPAWRTDYRCQIDWFLAFVHRKYGTMYAAAAYKFGWRDAKGVWHRRHGIY